MTPEIPLPPAFIQEGPSIGVTDSFVIIGDIEILVRPPGNPADPTSTGLGVQKPFLIW